MLFGHLLRVVQNSHVNKMTVRNMSIVFCPTLAIPSNLFTLFLSEYTGIFGKLGRSSESMDADFSPTDIFTSYGPETPVPEKEIEGDMNALKDLLSMSEDIGTYIPPPKPSLPPRPRDARPSPDSDSERPIRSAEPALPPRPTRDPVFPPRPLDDLEFSSISAIDLDSFKESPVYRSDKDDYDLLKDLKQYL